MSLKDVHNKSHLDPESERILTGIVSGKYKEKTTLSLNNTKISLNVAYYAVASALFVGTAYNEYLTNGFTTGVLVCSIFLILCLRGIAKEIKKQNEA